MGDRDDWASDVSERDIGLRDLELVEAQLATDGYREGIAFGRKLGGRALGAIEGLAVLEERNGGSDELRSAANTARERTFSQQPLGDGLWFLLEARLDASTLELLRSDIPKISFATNCREVFRPANEIVDNARALQPRDVCGSTLSIQR